MFASGTIFLLVFWLSAVKLCKCDINDLAHNKIAIQSSDWSSGYVAGKAVDGTYDTFSWTTERDNFPYWSVDLGMSTYVDHLYITHVNDRNENFIVTVSNATPSTYKHPARDSTTFTKCYQHSGYPPRNGRFKVTCTPRPILGHHVTIYLPTNHSVLIGLREVEVYGRVESPTTEKTTQMETSEGTCNRVPDLYTSSRNLTGCMSMESSGSDSSVTVRIHLTTSKQRTFHVSLSGIGLNCSPAGGIGMLTVSNNGGLIGCKALIGPHEEGLVTCHFDCKCPNVCSHAMAYIYNKVDVSLCKISD